MSLWQRKVELLENTINDKLNAPVKGYDIHGDLPNLVKNALNMQLNQMLDMLRVNPSLGNLPENTSKMTTIYDIIEHNAFVALVKHGEEFIFKKD